MAQTSIKLKQSITPLFFAVVSAEDIYYIQKLIENGAEVNEPVLEPARSVLSIAINKKLNLNIIKYLLDSGADKEYKIKYTNKTVHEEVKDQYEKSQGPSKDYLKKVLEYFGDLDLDDKKLWSGFSRSDIEKFDLFFEKPFDWSCCPICLAYAERSDGCMYMSHDCSKTKNHYHKELYDNFVYNDGAENKIEWCTVCGRITNFHKHYKITSAQRPLREFASMNREIQDRIDRGDNAAFFDNANCIGFGGGGIEEKAARFRRLREYALELQEDVNKKKYNAALDELIEEVWNAPLIRNRKIKKILDDKKWNINVKQFPENTRKNTNTHTNTNAANIEFKGTLPTIVDDDCIIMAEDEDSNTRETNPKYKFNHKDVGGIDHDGIYICQKDLSKAIQIKCAEFGLEDFGKCWFPNCKGTLHPEEPVHKFLSALLPNLFKYSAAPYRDWETDRKSVV